MLFALGPDELNAILGSAWFHGLKLVAMVVITQALWGMGKSFAPDRERASIVPSATITVSLFPTSLGQIGTLVAAAIIGLIFLWGSAIRPNDLPRLGGQKITG